MKKWMIALCLISAMLAASTGMAEGSFVPGDDWGVDMCVGYVISKSASIRAEPSYSSKKLISVPGETEIWVSLNSENGWRKARCINPKNEKQVEGWMREEYVIQNPITITLRKSNIPAYAAPDTNAKRVGSLPKYTELYVIGSWEDFYVVSLRGGSAFISMDAPHWRSDDVHDWFSIHKNYVATCETTLRTGPGEDWPEYMTCKEGTQIQASAEIDEGDWYFVLHEDKPAYAKKSDLRPE